MAWKEHSSPLGDQDADYYSVLGVSRKVNLHYSFYFEGYNRRT